jgi:putative inorganic carbon (HCO3(-)) transporter
MQAPLYPLTNSKLLLAILVPICSGLVLLNSLVGPIVNVVVIGVIAFFSILYISYFFPRYNIIFPLSMAFFTGLLIRILGLEGVPLGTANEAVYLIIILSLILNKKISGFKTIPGSLLIIWASYQIIELINPNSYSREAALLGLRTVIPLFCGYFIIYSSIETKRDAYIFLTAWFILSLLAGAYGLYQEFAGLPNYDFAWASENERRFSLLHTWGRLRKFSFFSSPSEFGMILVITGIAAFVVFFFIKKVKLRILSALTCFICLWAMVYTGSRTSTILLPVGLGIFCLITFQRKVLIAVGCLAVFAAAFILRPGSSKALFVMSTALSGTDDASMRVRIINQQIIRTYILQHPTGFGLGSTGDLGYKYSPQTFVGRFPPDSDYVKIAVECGWIGLLLWCIILAILFGYGITVYFRVTDSEWRMMLITANVVFFTMIVAQYPQEFLRSYVLSTLFGSVIGLIAKIDHKFRDPKIRRCC